MKKLILEAFDLKKRGYYKQAIEIYYKLLAKNGDDAEILTELADLYFCLGNDERAMHYVGKALDVAPDNVTTLKVANKVYLKEKGYKKAEENSLNIYEITKSNDDFNEYLKILFTEGEYSKIIELTEDNNSESCLYTRALSFLKLNEDDKALSVIKGLRANPDFNPDDYENILELTGKTYLEQNKIEEAYEVFKKLEENHSQTAEGLNLIGLEKLDNLELDDALEYFGNAIAKDDKNPAYYYNMGQAYFLKGWYEEAQKSFNTAICLKPDEEKYHYSLAYLYYRYGNYELAKAHLNPEYPDSRILLQVIKTEKGDYASAKTELENLLKEYPDNELILYSLTKIYYNLDMFKQAKTVIEKAIEVNPKNFDYRSLDVRILFKLGLLDEAKTKIDDLKQKYPNYYYVKVLEAELDLEKKDYESLYDTAQELIEADENHYEGYYYNALALFEKDDANFAIESLKKAISLDVNNADLYVKMSEFYQAVGKYEDAFAYIKEASDIDKSAKNRELYMKLANILRKQNGSLETGANEENS